MLKLFLWLRYLRKKKIVFLSIAAVALSVALLIVVASLFSGFIRALKQAGVESVEQLPEVVLHGRGRDQEDVLHAHRIDELPAEGLVVSQPVRLVDDDHVVVLAQDDLAIPDRLRRVQARDEKVR